MPLSRALLPAGALAALLLGGCAATPPPASAPPPADLARVPSPADPQSLLDGSPAGGNGVVVLDTPGGRCDPADPMAFDPGPRVDSLAILRVPGRGVASMPNACPVDARFQAEQATGRIRVRGTNSKVPR
jgi:hypothetical protein